jgi:hypothetical protein
MAYVPSGHLVINVVDATGDSKFGSTEHNTQRAGLRGKIPSDDELHQGHQKGGYVTSGAKPAPSRVRRAAGGWRAQLIEEEASLGQMLRQATIPGGHQGNAEQRSSSSQLHYRRIALGLAACDVVCAIGALLGRPSSAEIRSGLRGHSLVRQTLRAYMSGAGNQPQDIESSFETFLSLHRQGSDDEMTCR